MKQRTVRCQLSGRELPLNEVIPADLVRETLVTECKKHCREWDENGYVALDELNRLRIKHVDDLLTRDAALVSKLNQEVAKSLEHQDLLSQDVDQMFERKLSFGEKLSDRIADFGGSWTFIMIFLGFLVVWMVANGIILKTHSVDPYPFIFLNLLLSCVAALQAPVIMMSQNRQEERDRARGENDYKVNLKAELEIRHLHEKLDKLVQDQWKHLLEIQQMQIDMIEEMQQRKGASDAS